MPSRRFLLFAGLPILLVLSGIALWLLVLRPAPNAGLLAAPVTVGDVEQTVLATGKLKPKELVSVGAQVSGQVKRLYVGLDRLPQPPFSGNASLSRNSVYPVQFRER